MGYCLKSIGCWIWPVSRWSHRRVLWMKCSVTEGLTGKHEVREDVKRKGLLKSSWRLVLITLTQQWPTFPISDKQTIVLDYTLPLCNHNNTSLSSSYILFIQMVKNCYNYTCKDSWAFTCYGIWEWAIRRSSKAFKSEMFTCKAYSEKSQTFKNLPAPTSFMCPDVSWLESSRNTCPLVKRCQSPSFHLM